MFLIQSLQAITYVNMIILIVSVVLAFAVSNFANAKAAVNGLSVLVGAYFNLSLVFLPKVGPYYYMGTSYTFPITHLWWS